MTDRPTSAFCPKCQIEMRYVTAMPHPKAPEMQRTTFVCYTCNQTRTYVLSSAMAGVYAAASNAAEPAPAARA